MSNDRRTIAASPRAVDRVRTLRADGKTAPVESVREIIVGGSSVVSAEAPRERAQEPLARDVCPTHDAPELIGGMAATGELEPPVRNALTETVSKLFGGAISVQVGRVKKAVAKINEAAAVATRNEDTGAAPTPQRAAIAAQQNGLRRPKPGVTQPTRVRSTMDVFGVHFTKSEREIFRRFVNDAENATKVNITSKIYENMPRGGSGQGSDMSENQRLAHTRFYYIWRRLEPQFQTLVTASVLEVRSETLSRSFTMEELGQQATNYTDKALCRAAALGMTKAALWRLAGLYLQWNALDDEAMKVVQEAQAELDRQKADSLEHRLGRRLESKPEPVRV